MTDVSTTFTNLLDRSEVRIDVRSLDCAFHFVAVGGGWETLAVLVDVTRLATAESEDKLGRYFSD